jgi:hypothetical protein
MSTLLQDLKFSLRLLAKTPGFTAAAIGVLALGIGLNTGMFTFIYGLAFQPRSFADPDRVVQLYTQDRKNPRSFRIFSHPLWRELNARPDLRRGGRVQPHHRRPAIGQRDAPRLLLARQRQLL